MTNQAREKFKIYKNVFDEFTLSTLFKLSSQGHFDELLQPIKIGKEANVFLADKGEDFVVVKIYRLASCNFNKMYYYIKSDPRFMEIKNRRRLVIFKWVQREYRNLLLARQKINVPTPIAFLNNVLVMESIGGNSPSPQLKDQRPKNSEKFFKKIVKFIEDLASIGLVHADLSEFNILNNNDVPYFIDLSQATTTTDPNASDYLRRDLENISNSAKKYGIMIDANKTFEKLKRKYLNRN